MHAAAAPRVPVLARPKSLEPVYSADFLAFWPDYPRHTAKALASKAYDHVRKRGATVEQMADAARHYAAFVAACGTAEEHVPYASTWLNNGLWLEYRDGVPAVPARAPPRSNGHAPTSKLAHTAVNFQRIFPQEHTGDDDAGEESPGLPGGRVPDHGRRGRDAGDLPRLPPGAALA